MSHNKLRIGTRDSQLAVWQATLVQSMLKENGVESELIYIKSEGDIDTVTPLYELGVQGVFTKALDAALLDKRIDIAVHSMKDVPTQLAAGIIQAAVLKRANYKDLFVPRPGTNMSNLFEATNEHAIVATSSIRRIAQWKHRFPNHEIENLRGNVNTRLQKLKDSNWHGAIFAAAGLERIGLRPDSAIELDWMLPAPAQGAIMVVCREDDNSAFIPLQSFNDLDTMLCTKIERDFLRTLMGGCSTPISAFAEVKNGEVHFRYNITGTDGIEMVAGNAALKTQDATEMGITIAENVLATNKGIVENIRKNGPAK
jgi:hydroxymethylbilane synthase